MRLFLDQEASGPAERSTLAKLAKPLDGAE
jgi:hypothetical protein